MTRRRGATAIASNPVLVGVATTLVIVVAVFLAYNANQGLPWVPSYRLTAEVPIATSLVKGNEVRIGGLRVGVVDKITPVQQDNGSVMAQLDLKLETRIKPLPVDSTIIVRPRSALGLKYVEVTRGDSARGLRRGRHDPARERRRPSRSSSTSSSTCGTARRGSATSRTCAGSATRSPAAAPTSTGPPGARPAGRRTPCRSCPTSPTRRRTSAASSRRSRGPRSSPSPSPSSWAQLWANLSLTSAAFADVARPFLQDTITKGAGGQEQAIETFPKLRPFFDANGEFFASCSRARGR